MKAVSGGLNSDNYMKPRGEWPEIVNRIKEAVKEKIQNH